jgi:hypothetical protein
MGPREYRFYYNSLAQQNPSAISVPRVIQFPQPPSLCEACRHCRVITSGKGSRFFLCEAALANTQLPKYPPQPVIRCAAYEPPEVREPEQSP